VHQLLGLGVERPSVVRLLEVIGVALAGVEVALSNIRHAYMLPPPSELFWGRPGPAEGRQKSVWIAEPAAGRRLEHHTGQVHAACPEFRLGVQTKSEIDLYLLILALD